MSTNPASTRHTSRGIAMITALFMIAVLFIMMLPLLDIMHGEVVLAGSHANSNLAWRAAYAGIEETVYQFELNDSGLAPGLPPNSPQVGSYTNDDGTVESYSVTIDPTIWTSVLPYYVLHATGGAGPASRHVDALIQKQPFSAWGLFTISEKNNKGGAVVYASGETFVGPVYSGGPMNIVYTSGDPTAIFQGGVTTASPPNWIPHAPGSPADWQAISGVPGNFVQVSQPMTLPTVNDNLAVEYAALVGNPAPSVTPTPPVVTGMYINDAPVAGGGGALNSGIYIAGGATVTSTASGTMANNGTDTMTFSVCPGNPPCATPTVYTVIITYGASPTTVVKDGSGTIIASYTGAPSGQNPPGDTGPVGAIFASNSLDFNANNTYHGQFTFAVPDGKGLGNPPMYMYGTQMYVDPTDDELAFWANDIVLNDLVDSSVEVDGLLLTGYYGECTAVCIDGTFYNQNCGINLCTGGTGTLTLFGSLIENVRGKRGTLGSTITGYATNGIFDPRLARTPPPFTPDTTAWQVISLCTTDNSTTCGQQ